MAVIRQPFPHIGADNTNLLRIMGLVLVAFSAILGPIILFATPIGCSFVGGIQAIIFGFLSILGVILFAASFLSKKRT